MRFEIRSGGVFAILVGIAVLSGAVFVLGLLAGYDVGRDSQTNLAQVATAYPVAPPPARESAPQGPASPAPIAPSPSGETASQPPAAQATPSARHTQNTVASVSTPATTRPARAPHRRISAAEIPQASSANPRQPDESGADNGGGAEEAADEVPAAESSEPGNAIPAPLDHADSTRPAAVPPRRKPYNIQIEAAMDINGADSMVKRLQRLGYTPHLVSTRINGQTWFKVEVGPYATAQEAQAAQAQLRERYAATYGSHPHGGAGGAANSNSGADNSDSGGE